MEKRVRRSRAGRNDFETFAVSCACRAGYYDTNDSFQIPGGVDREPLIALTVERFLPTGATHYFSIQVEQTGYRFTRYPDRWVIEFDDKTEEQRRERQLREGALDTALKYFANRLGRDLEECNKAEFIADLLNDGLGFDSRRVLISGLHPIVHDEPLFQGIRRWSVTVGSYCCFVILTKNEDEPEFAILPT